MRSRTALLAAAIAALLLLVAAFAASLTVRELLEFHAWPDPPSPRSTLKSP